MIPGVLIAQDPDEAAGPQQLDRFVEPFAPIEQLSAGARPFSIYVPIQVTVPQFLINRSDPCVMKVVRHQRPGNFPIADMTQKHDHGPADPQMLMNGVRIFRVDIARQFFRRHRPELRAAEETGAGPLEMAPANLAQFSRGFFVREGDLEIAPGKPPILRQEEPAGEAHEIPKNK